MGDAVFLYRRLKESPQTEWPRLIAATRSPVYLSCQNEPINRIDACGLWWWSAYEKKENADGTHTITVKKKCVIVVTYGHGIKSKKPKKLLGHKYVFEKECTAGGFNGCHAGKTNKSILPVDKRSHQLNYGMWEVHKGTVWQELAYPEKQRFGYWQPKLKAGAISKAEALCKKEECNCCKKIKIYGVKLKGALFPGNYYDEVDCSTVP